MTKKRRRFETATDYLRAVVAGDEPPDGARIRAAAKLLPYERELGETPKRRKTRIDAELEAAAREAWRKKSEAIRARRGAP